MNRHDLLRGLHAVLQPRTYFEIGVNRGLSLTLSRCPTVAVDPFFKIDQEINCDLHLVATSSDEFFSRRQPLAHLPSPVVDLAFIDGMHLSEYALRDFINTERFCRASSVIVFDDMLPTTVRQAERGRNVWSPAGRWAGDVYKVIETLETVRPDLIVLQMDTAPTGTLVILLPDPADTTLAAAYDDVAEGYLTPDPQPVPKWVLDRSRAMSGQQLLDSPVWPEIRRLRALPADVGRSRIRDRFLEAGFGPRH